MYCPLHPQKTKEGAKSLSAQYILKVENLTKRFTSVIANDAINLDIGENEIVGIIGENGAGKSTFCKMLTGIYQPTEGAIYIHGKEIKFHSPKESMQAGINMVYQERNLVGMYTGAENICLGHEIKRAGLIDKKEMLRQATKIRDRLGLSVPLDVPVETLGAGEQQLIEIMRAFYTNPQILILDEPTASLGEGEIEPFLNFIKSIKQTMQISVIFISHKLEEVFEITDKIAVFTDGRCVLCRPTDTLTQDECISAMLRSDKIKPLEIDEEDFSNAETVLSYEKAFYDGKEHHLNIDVKRGEILGFYGLVGAGRTESVEVLIGLRRAENLSYTFNGETIHKPNPLAMIERGMVMTPEKRSDAIFKTFSLEDNICNMFLEEKLASKRMGFVDFEKCKQFATDVLNKNSVKYSSISQPILDLSGGNMQKVIIGRSIEVENLKLLILDEPTTGMDIGAKYEIYRKIISLAHESSVSIIFISSELDELMAVCDRMYIFNDGNAVRSFLRKDFNKSELLETAVRRMAV